MSRSRRRRRAPVRRSRRPASRPRNTILNRVRYYPQKLTGIIRVEAGTALTGSKTFVFSRYDYSGIVSANYGVNSAPRWAAVHSNYEQYAVTGFALKWIPTNGVGTTGNANVSGLISAAQVWEDIDSIAIGNYSDD